MSHMRELNPREMEAADGGGWKLCVLGPVACVVGIVGTVAVLGWAYYDTHVKTPEKGK